MRNYKAVVIDDEYFIRTGFKFLLDWEKLRMEIAGQASDGEQGLELVKELCPDVVFLDIKMPKMDGLTMLKKLREETQELKMENEILKKATAYFADRNVKKWNSQ